MLLPPLLQIFENNQNHFTVETNNAAQLVDTAARNIENFLKKRAKALRVRPCCFINVAHKQTKNNGCLMQMDVCNFQTCVNNQI